MKIRSLLYLNLVFFFFLNSHINAQGTAENIQSGSYTNSSIKTILDQIAEVYKLNIYYQEDSQLERNTNITFSDQNIDEVVTELLKATTLGHINYRNYGIVIAPKILVNENFSSDFYKALNSSNDVADVPKLIVGDISTLDPSGKASVKGIIIDVTSGEPIIGATVQIEKLSFGTASDLDGAYDLTLPAGEHELVVRSVGYADFVKTIDIRGNGALNIEMDKGAIELEEVTISARNAEARLSNAQIGVQSLDLSQIEKLPTFLGEVDVIKSFLLQPGVSSIGEGASGFNVRGGDVDQNLILQDGGFLLNSSHALGFYSTFNSELIKSVDLYKGNIPAQYGGRLASVMDVEMRDGNFEAFKIKGGVGPVSSRIIVEGPILKDKVSFIGGFRSSYTDWILKRVKNIEVQRSSAFFYDGNARITIKPNAKNTITLAAYASSDEFFYNEEFGFEYTTKMAELNFKSILTNTVFSKLSVTASSYESTQYDLDGLDASKLDNRINYVRAKENIRIVPREGFEINTGVSAVLYDVDPGSSAPFGDISAVPEKTLDKEKGLEGAAFLNAEYALSDALTLSGGVRFNYFALNGPREIFQYENPERPLTAEITGSSIKDGQVASYTTIEPRFSLRFSLSDDASIKTGYSRTSQFISQIFNSASPTPTSQWQLSTDYIKPLRSHNVSIGYFQNFNDNDWETSFELYGRKIDQLFDYKDFADLIVNPHLETELINGEGRSYGAEVSLKKKGGKLNGFFSLTLAKSERKVEGISKNEWYPSNFDKPVDASLVLNYNPNKRNTFTLNFNYGTGRPTTAPVGNYTLPTGQFVPVYSERNSLRIPDYVRMDLAYTIGQGYKVNQKFRTSWTISIYNVLSRKNAFSVFFTQGPFQSAQANRLAVLGSAFPSITLNFELL